MSVNKTAMALILSGAFLAACSSTDQKDLLSGGQTGTIDAATSGYQGDNPNNDPQLQGLNKYDGIVANTSTDADQGFDPAQGNPNSPLAKQTIYFMYDSSNIQPEFMPVIDAHSKYLVAHPHQVVILEGHADERGAREYNIALGEERAKSVAKLMQERGVFKGQLEIVSYGEEKPASTNHDEAAWHLNRRVKLTYIRTQK